MTKSQRVLWLVVLSMLLSSRGMAHSEPPSLHAAHAASSYNPNELSYGLYWFGLDDASQQFVPGQANPYFDPAKPTLIFAHGWQPFLSYDLPGFAFDGVDTVAGWIDAGWNVGIFVWNQFSDETTGVSSDWFGDGPPPEGVLDAEAKVWTANGARGMRWRDWDNYLGGGYSAPPAGTPSAGELFYDTYVAALTDALYTGGAIRVVGHSLGNQMAVRLAKLVDESIAAGEIPAHLRPTRVALLDPYWSPEPRDDLTGSDAAGRKTGDVVREYIAALTPGGTLFEWYWSSAWTTPPQGDANPDLKPMTLYAEMAPLYATQELDKHLAAQHLYFWAYAFDGPAPCAGEACLDMTRVLSAMSDDQLAAVLRSDYRWVQDGGQATGTPADDTYHSVLQSGAPYTVTMLTAMPVTHTVGGFVTVTATVSAPDGALVTFATDLGTISPRSVTRDGTARARLHSDVAGVAHISATTRGTGGTVQSTTRVTFVTPIRTYLPLLSKNPRPEY